MAHTDKYSRWIKILRHSLSGSDLDNWRRHQCDVMQRHLQLPPGTPNRTKVEVVLDIWSQTGRNTPPRKQGESWKAAALRLAGDSSYLQGYAKVMFNITTERMVSPFSTLQKTIEERYTISEAA